MAREVRDAFSVTKATPVEFGESMTKQEFAKECDINQIMAGYLRLGTVPQRTDMARYGDFASAPDYFEAQNILKDASDKFSALSANVRERFGNDPGKFLAWIHDQKVSLEEKHELGLLSEEGVRKVAERKSKAEAEAAAKAAVK